MIADRLKDGRIICECCHQSVTTGPDGCILCESCNRPLTVEIVDFTRCQKCRALLEEEGDFLCPPCAEASGNIVDGRCDACLAADAPPFHLEFVGMVQIDESEMPVVCSFCSRRAWSFKDLRRPEVRETFEREWMG